MSMKKDSDKITVCSECLTASCWKGIFMCFDSYAAGVKELTVAELKNLDREHPCYWEDEEIILRTSLAK